MDYNEFVNMIVRNSEWPTKVSFVSPNATVGRLVSTYWGEVDIPNMIETLVTNRYTVTITDVNTYMITKTILGAETSDKKSVSTTMDKERGKNNVKN